MTIGAYDSGPQPRIENAHENVMITGTYEVIQDVFTRSDAVGYDAGCQNAPYGWRVGFRLAAGSSHDIIRDSTAVGQYIGIYVERGSDNNRIERNTLENNRLKDPDPASGSGGVGISLMGDDNEVVSNVISGSDMCSELYGRDGSAIEVYGGQRNRIYRNVGRDNNAFTELGNARSADNTYAYNEATSSLPNAAFLVTRGPSDAYGPVYGTVVLNSSVYLSGLSSVGIECTGGCSPHVLRFVNNIVSAAGRVGLADGGFTDENNLYWRSDGKPQLDFAIGSSSGIADPDFVNAPAGDLHLRGDSPALNRATFDALNDGFHEDLDGHRLDGGHRPDLGAHAFMAPGGATVQISPAPSAP